MRIKLATLLILFSLGLIAHAGQDEGASRLNTLLERSNQYSNRIIPFSIQDFQYTLINPENMS